MTRNSANCKKKKKKKKDLKEDANKIYYNFSDLCFH